MRHKVIKAGAKLVAVAMSEKHRTQTMERKKKEDLAKGWIGCEREKIQRERRR